MKDASDASGKKPAPRPAMKKLQHALLGLDTDAAVSAAQQLRKDGTPLLDVLQEAVLSALDVLSRSYDTGELYIPQMLVAADAFETAIGALTEGREDEIHDALMDGRVEIYTVEGDIHDIGKNLVGTILRASGFAILDLGRNVPAEQVIAEARKWRPDVIIGFALMTTTVPEQRTLVEQLSEQDMRDHVAVLVGGDVVSERWAQEIGADGYARTAFDAVRLVRDMVARRRNAAREAAGEV
ncbi:MAG: cobalamin-dependent protein [Veillonellaceae bacterium]|nr:cobalamin-dependent protein [Veillonellaceae bacterium]